MSIHVGFFKKISNFKDKTHFFAFNYSILKYTIHPTLYLLIYFILLKYLLLNFLLPPDPPSSPTDLNSLSLSLSLTNLQTHPRWQINPITTPNSPMLANQLHHHSKTHPRQPNQPIITNLQNSPTPARSEPPPTTHTTFFLSNKFIDY